MSIRNLDKLLAPRSVALIGASDRPGSLGAIVAARLTGAGFDGPIRFVNPGHAEVAGQPCWPSVAELPEPPDLGVIVTPARTVPGLIGELGAAGGRAAVVITAGVTRESGLRQQMLDAARPYTLRVMGPNCVGLVVPGAGLDASFVHLPARKGRLALLSQSGAIVTAMLDWAEARGIGFSVAASLGDMADVDTGDMLDRLAGDAGTGAILMYLEQVTDARKFMSAARAAARVKPVIAVKAGRSAAAARAAASHTGALAGEDAVYDAALRRAGILRVTELEHLFDAADALARHRPLQSDRLAIVTNGGGAGVLATDALSDSGARLAELAPETVAALDAALPATWSRANPVDIIGDAGPERYAAAMAAVLDDPATDAVLVMNCPTGLASSDDAAGAVAEAAAARPSGGRRAKPVFACWLGEATAQPAARKLEAAGIPTYRTPAQAVRGFAELAEHRKAQTALMRTPPALPEDFTPDRDAVRAALDRALGEGRRLLTEPEAKDVLRAYGVPTVETRIAGDAEEAGRVAEELLGREAGGAVVVKILSPDITHKSDVGGVRLNLASAAEARDAAAAMIAQARKVAPEARIEGVAVQPMIHRPDAHELILGLSDDAVFGPVMLFGAGGTSVEVVADKALALPPLDLVLADDMISGTRISRLMAGYRGHAPADRDAVALALVRLSQLAADFPEIRELDINPMLADAQGALALDARIAVAPADPVAPGGNPRFALRPYPSAWDRVEEIRGHEVRLRPIRPADERLYPDFFAKLTPQDRRMRFFGTVSMTAHEQIARYTQIDYARAMAFVAIEPGDGSLLGVSRLAADPDYEQAEFAVVVRSDMHRRGLGRALMQRLIDYARAEGIGELWGDVMAENRGMLRMCRDLGFRDASHPEETRIRRLTLPTGGGAARG